MSSEISRRKFAGFVGATLGASAFPSWLRAVPRAVPRTAAAPAASTDWIRLSSNENPYPLSARALEALNRASRAASRYPDEVEDEARAAIAKSHGVPVEQVVLGCGSSDILHMADAAFLPPGKTVVAAEPTFEAVLLHARVTNSEAVKVPLTSDHRHDLDRMAAACDARTGLVYVCNPNNPTGTIVGGDELEAFFGRVPSSAVVLVDEAYHHFVENPRYRTAAGMIERFPNVVVARTFSKIYGMAGMRLGYGLASRANAEALSRQASWNNTNTAGLHIALAGLADPGLVPAQRRLLNDTRRWLCGELDRDGRGYIPSETNFVMIDVGRDVSPVILAFREKKIQVGRKFPSLSNWLRVSIGTREETTAFLAALRDIVPARAVA
ncbi:MAG: aminotransferase class I/II-fold pyridoxal phosphate-dependent enzyme [Acidobacteriota bacterium]